MFPHLITYDLNKPGQDYNELYEAIKNLGSWCHPLDSFWVVLSSSSSAQIRDYLMQYMDSNDGIFVTHLTSDSAWAGLPQECSDWLKTNL